jgi:hypothetical protein
MNFADSDLPLLLPVVEFWASIKRCSRRSKIFEAITNLLS